MLAVSDAAYNMQRNTTRAERFCAYCYARRRVARRGCVKIIDRSMISQATKGAGEIAFHATAPITRRC
jgi:hypothetical protein